MMRLLGALSRGLLRVLALLLLTGALAGVPLLVFRVVGVPLPGLGALGAAWRENRIDADLVVRIGAAVFALLWLWFAATALAELWHVLAWRFGGPTARLAPLPAGPSGWVRGLVRFIALSSVSATAAFGSLVPLAQAASTATTAAPAAATTLSTVGSPTGLPTQVTRSTHLASGRETPYSLAAAHGRSELRERIIQLNLGRPGPDGSPWQGGLFPAGMQVLLPDELQVPTQLGAAHEVVAGDSYWAIADAHLSAELDRDATPHEVFDYTSELVTFNHGLLGHRDPTLIVPGELVIYVDAPMAPEAVPPVVAEVPSVVAPAPATPSDVAAEIPAGEAAATPDVPFSPPTGPPIELAVAPTGAPTDLSVAPAEAPVPLPIDVVAGDQSYVAPGGAEEGQSGVVPFAAGLGTALMMSAGAVGLLETRRRRQLRSSTVGARLAPSSAEQRSTEVLLRSLHASERMARLDLAVRAAAPSLAAQGASVLAAVLYDTGDLCLFLRGCATPDGPEWKLDPHANTWRLSGSTSLAELATLARRCAQPCPAMVQVGGVAEGGEVFVDVEAVGTLTVRSPHAAAILRSIAAALAVSPFIEGTRLFTVGLGPVSLGSTNSEPVDSFDAALDAAAMALGSTGQLARDASTFSLRVTGAGGEAWEPAVVVAASGAIAGSDPLADLGPDLRGAAGGGRGLAVVLDAPLDVGPSDGSWQIRYADGRHLLEPLGLTVLPVGLTEEDVAAVAALLADADRPLSSASGPPLERDVAVHFGGGLDDVPAAFVEPDWALLVRVLGQVRVTSSAGATADCERSKATELIVWLSQHRERPTRNAARTALWDLDVRDATFANVVSDARRAMARAIAPADGEEWIARTLTEELPLHPRVVTDAELLSARVEHARGLCALDAIEVLRPGLELLTGMPFAGTSYLWPDAEGITSSFVLLATGAAIELANHYLSLGDVEGVFWATRQGLKVLSGHEELIALRMRAHARRGDLAGVRGEWESYERAIAADPWAAAEPAPKLVALRRELLSPSHATTG